MIKPIVKQHSLYLIVLWVTSFIFSGFAIIIKQTGDIILHDEKLAITPKEFYITNVIDERANRTAIAWLILPDKSISLSKAYPVNFKGGGLVAIKQFINHSLPRNSSLRPVVIIVKKYMATETALANGLIEGNAEVKMSFNLQGDDEMLHLIDYESTAAYTRNAGPSQDVEPTLRRMLGNSLTFFDTWINRQADTNIKLAAAVQVSFADLKEKPEGDTIYYSFNRPLSWDDFMSKIPTNSYEAEVYPSIGYEEQISISKHIIHLNLGIKVCLPKSACWVKDRSRNDYTLNHEQRHFDIAKIVACHFKQKVRTENLPVGNYDGYINADYLDAYREMDSLQKQYDNETSHGSDRFMQEKWNEKIDAELKVFKTL